METLGIIGGLGPMATAYFLELIVESTDASIDQEHLNSIIYNFPCIPDRTDFILGKSSDNPKPYLLDIAKKLQSSDVMCIAVPCITAHYFHDDLESAVNIPVINGIRETCKVLNDRNVKTVTVLGTEGTIKSKIFENELNKFGITAVTPNEYCQKTVNKLIYDNIKAGTKPSADDFYNVKNEALRQGAQAVILGCTELSCLRKFFDLGDNVIDTLEVLAVTAIQNCGKKSKKSLVDLINIK